MKGINSNPPHSTPHGRPSLSRLQYDREIQRVSYTYTSSYDKREHTEELSPLEMIARLTTHIPAHYERSIRYYGV